ncbi:MAG: shikimate kinase, partial [Planctomycetota bacterium]
MRIVLMGYRGSGKSTVGRAVAERLAMPFVDLDDAVRDRFGGATIAEIWAEHGEPAFRRAEAAAAVEHLQGPGIVLALGGGTPMQPAAAEAIAAADALRIYLHAPPEVLHERIVDDATSTDQRPALTAAGGSLDEVRRVLVERDPVYRRLADLTLDASDVAQLGAVTDTIAQR